jgi:hypothetical protein
MGDWLPTALNIPESWCIRGEFVETNMNGLILITGATGYVGGRLWRRLEAEGRLVRRLARRRTGLASRVGPATRVVEGDVLEPETLGPALSRGRLAGVGFSPEMVAACTKRFASLIAAGRVELRCATRTLSRTATPNSTGPVRSVPYTSGRTRQRP